MPELLLEGTEYKSITFNSVSCQIPSENFIKRICSQFDEFLLTKGVVIQGYQGFQVDEESEDDSTKQVSLEDDLKTLEKERRGNEFEQVHRLDAFSSLDYDELPDMKNGHVYHEDKLNRLFILKNNDGVVVGDVFFIIDLDNKLAYQTLSSVLNPVSNVVSTSLPAKTFT